MPTAGDGTYTLTGTLAPPGQVSNSTAINAIMADIATGLTERINVNGTKPMAAALAMGSHKITGVTDGTAVQDAATINNLVAGNVAFAVAGGTGDAITATFSPAITALVDGMVVRVRAGAANTITTPTFSPNGLTARTIVKGAGSALVSGDIIGANHHLFLQYRATGTTWSLLNPANASTPFDLAAPHTFTALQTFSTTAADTEVIEAVSTDAGAGRGPNISLFRDSASPATSDLLGSLNWYGRDSAGNKQIYAAIVPLVVDKTSGSEDVNLYFETVIAGAQGGKFAIGAGLFSTNATGGDKGADTINASAYYVNGAALTAAALTLITTLTTTSGTTQSVTGIDSSYRSVYFELEGVSFSAGATLNIAVSNDNGANYGSTVNVSASTSSGAGVIIGTIHVYGIQIVGASFGVAPLTTATGGGGFSSQTLANPNSGNGPINAIRFAGGTFDAGTIRVYGIK